MAAFEFLTTLILYAFAVVGGFCLTWGILTSVLIRKTGDTIVMSLGLAMLTGSLYLLEPNTRVACFIAVVAACLYVWHTSKNRKIT